MNATYPGLQWIQRDTYVRKLEKRYAEGMLLRDDRAVFGSFLVSGLTQPHRFAIYTNRVLEAEGDEVGSGWEMGTISAGARFKVLDICRRPGRTQITLLHLPEDGWELFADVSTNVDESLIGYSRQKFDLALTMKPLPALLDEQWRRLCSHAIGMTDFGQISLE